jgi:zinc/manganese transport system substrate-binding protein
VLLPSTSSQAEVSAANLARLTRTIEDQGVTVIFAETGTPPGGADAIGRETGARVVEIATHTLPDDGDYATFITGVANTVADAYAPAS